MDPESERFVEALNDDLSQPPASLLTKPFSPDNLSNYPIRPYHALESDVSVARPSSPSVDSSSRSGLKLPTAPSFKRDLLRKKPRTFRQRNPPAKKVAPPARRET